jgi:hypothetical protein
MPELKTIVVSIMSPGVAKGGGGFVIINGKVKRIPPHSPKLKELGAAMNMLSQAEDVADKKARSQITEFSQSLIAANANGLVEEAGK